MKVTFCCKQDSCPGTPVLGGAAPPVGLGKAPPARITAVHTCPILPVSNRMPGSSVEAKESRPRQVEAHPEVPAAPRCAQRLAGSAHARGALGPGRAAGPPCPQGCCHLQRQAGWRGAGSAPWPAAARAAPPAGAAAGGGRQAAQQALPPHRAAARQMRAAAQPPVTACGAQVCRLAWTIALVTLIPTLIETSCGDRNATRAHSTLSERC